MIEMTDQEAFARRVCLAVIFFKELKEEDERGHTGGIKLLRPAHFRNAHGNLFRRYMLDDVFKDGNRSLLDAAVAVASGHPALGDPPQYPIHEIHGHLVELSHRCDWSPGLPEKPLAEGEKLERSFRRAARFIKWNLEDGSTGKGNSRLDFFVFDHYLPRGYSKSGDDRAEHVVPCAKIRDEVRERFTAGYNLQDMVRFIRKYYAIVQISEGERERLDNGLRLKVEMPAGWDWKNGCLFERLHAAHIDFIPPDPLPPGANLCDSCHQSISR